MYKLTKRVYDRDCYGYDLTKVTKEHYGYYLTKKLAEVARKKWCPGDVTYSWSSGYRTGMISWDIDPINVYEKEEEI